MTPPASRETEADAVAGFLGRYLACSAEQATVLSLWVIYTWCFRHFSTAAYLSIRSPESQCGKSLCLELLELLCDSPWRVTGADPRTLGSRLLTADTRTRPEEDFVPHPPHTILLDDCHHAFHGSDRQPLVALLNSGTRASGRFVRYRSEYCVFGPKVFAGNADGDLPESLASRCIPIMLNRKKPSEVLSRFHRGLQPADAESLQQSLAEWADNNASALAEAAERVPECLPLGLTPHQQDGAEPLLHIADLIGGLWPEKARAALTPIFNFSDGSRSVQILSDVRQAFTSKGNPDYIATSDLLSMIIGFDHRHWSELPCNTGRRLAILLHPFGIASRNLRIDAETVLRGYLLRDFEDAWERYLPIASRSTTDFESATEIAAIGAPRSAKAD